MTKDAANRDAGIGASPTHLPPWRLALRIAPLTVILLAVLFLSAGTMAWPGAWVYIAITLLLTVGSRLVLAHYSPDLVRERASYAEKKDTKSWDRVLMPVVAIYGPLVTLLVSGLDRRWGGLPAVPLALQLLAALLLVLANLLGIWAMLANRFFSGVVRIQTDRGHVPVTTGPYRWIRHPGYAGGVLGDLAIPFVLGSVWALIPAALTALAVILRTALEDRTLQAELPGYAAYAQHTRYRLLPGFW